MTKAETQDIRQVTDGVNLEVGSLAVRNALLIATPNGKNARFIATIVNQTNQSEALTIEAKDNSGDQKTVRIPANSTVDLAKSAKTDQVVFRKVDVKPGDLTKMFFTYPGASGASTGVPVLTGAMAEYATLVPTPAASPSASASNAPSATQSPVRPIVGPSASASASPSPSASTNG